MSNAAPVGVPDTDATGLTDVADTTAAADANDLTDGADTTADTDTIEVIDVTEVADTIKGVPDVTDAAGALTWPTQL